MASATGALLIHGLGGTQYDLGSMHKILKRAGIETHSLTLPGHGGQPEDLVSIKAEDWIAAVTAKYREVVDQHETLHVMGMCMGSLLAIELCRREKHTKGHLVTLAPPIYIDGWSTPWYTMLRHLLYYVPGVPARMKVEEEDPFGIKNELVRAIVKAKFERGEAFHYRWVPLACVRQVDRLRRWVMRGANEIACPALIVHAREDELTSLRSAQFLKQRFQRAELEVLENSYHMICVDNDREAVAQRVLTFFVIDPASIQRQTVEEPDVPMSAADGEALIGTFLAAMKDQAYETLFPLFASNARWEQPGNHPVAGDYVERSQLIDLFSRLMEHSGGTFAVSAFGAPAYDAVTQTARVSMTFRVGTGAAAREASGMQSIRVRNGRIVHVIYTPDDPAHDDALWTQGVASSPGGKRMQTHPISPEAAALPAAELPNAFTQATQDVKGLANRPGNQTLLQLYGLFKQGSEGDAGGDRPGFTDPIGRAKYDAWAALAGVSQDDAKRQYISLVQSLRAGE
ncbi:acyl-CoA-binding protein [Achromobacter sp. GG226]|uniref:acyl-CoA-binding protein n=1 Tax=Verticiella alkaliphila TaxID=2779529 RepID=UPI001C0E4383|nr:acyl-CoA-binding protein [Verticiella sp. GG226]MBU4611523.1 acyl-CoA-binding protein [Verticiella sp. GG226]